MREIQIVLRCPETLAGTVWADATEMKGVIIEKCIVVKNLPRERNIPPDGVSIYEIIEKTAKANPDGFTSIVLEDALEAAGLSRKSAASALYNGVRNGTLVATKLNSTNNRRRYSYRLGKGSSLQYRTHSEPPKKMNGHSVKALPPPKQQTRAPYPTLTRRTQLEVLADIVALKPQFTNADLKEGFRMAGLSPTSVGSFLTSRQKMGVLRIAHRGRGSRGNDRHLYEMVAK